LIEPFFQSSNFIITRDSHNADKRKDTKNINVFTKHDNFNENFAVSFNVNSSDNFMYFFAGIYYLTLNNLFTGDFAPDTNTYQNLDNAK
jgi:hypothetical protein